MDIRHLRYFVAVAEALSFARAARTLHMSQPPLSKRIADLEEDLGLRLFHRTSKMVSLTEAGESFLGPAREAVRAFDTAMRVARSTSPVQSRRLRIAFTEETLRSVVLTTIDKLQQENIEVEILEESTAEQQQLLTAGEIDIGVLRHPFATQGLRVSAPLGQPLGVVLAREHPLATVETLRLADLSPYALVQFHRHIAPGLYDELLHLCRAGGYVPPRILHAVKMTGPLLKTNFAVTLLAERLFRQKGEAGSKGFIWRPLEGSPIRWWTSVVRRPDGSAGLTRLAVDIISAALQMHEGWTSMPLPVGTRRSKSASKQGTSVKPRKRAAAT